MELAPFAFADIPQREWLVADYVVRTRHMSDDVAPLLRALRCDPQMRVRNTHTVATSRTLHKEDEDEEEEDEEDEEEEEEDLSDEEEQRLLAEAEHNLTNAMSWGDAVYKRLMNERRLNNDRGLRKAAYF